MRNGRSDPCVSVCSQVFVFDVGGKTWKSYNWSLVTTVAAFGKYDSELVCFAHSKGARVVLKGRSLFFLTSEDQRIPSEVLSFSCSLSPRTGDVHLPDIVDPTNRTLWITEKVHLAKTQFMDGINLDIEQSVEKDTPEYFALTSLVKETTEAFHREIPGSQVNTQRSPSFFTNGLR